jgi:hypothetical protein
MKKNYTWATYDQPTEVADEINYLGAASENTGKWNKQRLN